MSQVSGWLSPYLARKRLFQVLACIEGNSLAILDIGCGDADEIPHLSNRIQRFTGIDTIGEVITNDKKRYPHHHFMQGSIFNVDLNNQQFTHIIMAAFLEHIHYHESVELFRKLKNHLKPNGVIVVTTPHPFAEWIHDFGSRVGIFSREAACEHKCFFNKKKLMRLAADSGFTVKRYRRFEFGLNQLCVFEAA